MWLNELWLFLADLKWFDKYGNEINEKDGSKDIHISETNQFIRLIFLSTKKRDSGNYTCKIIKVIFIVFIELFLILCLF